MKSGFLRSSAVIAMEFPFLFIMKTYNENEICKIYQSNCIVLISCVFAKLKWISVIQDWWIEGTAATYMTGGEWLRKQQFWPQSSKKTGILGR